MSDAIDYVIHGDDMQTVEVELDPGESVRAEVGAMLYMDPDIEMQTNTGGGLFQGLKRMVSGAGFFITSFTHAGTTGKRHVAFAAPYPGKIIALDLKHYDGEFICQKDAFLCAAHGIDVGVALTQKLGAGIFGGEGFILQRLTGDGLAFVHAGGTVIKKTLQPDESLKLDVGCLVGLENTVNYDIQRVKGVKNLLFGGEGLFLIHLTGPGTVYLQSLPFARLADRIVAASKLLRHERSRR